MQRGQGKQAFCCCCCSRVALLGTAGLCMPPVGNGSDPCHHCQQPFLCERRLCPGICSGAGSALKLTADSALVHHPIVEGFLLEELAGGPPIQSVLRAGSDSKPDVTLVFQRPEQALGSGRRPLTRTSSSARAPGLFSWRSVEKVNSMARKEQGHPFSEPETLPKIPMPICFGATCSTQEMQAMRCEDAPSAHHQCHRSQATLWSTRPAGLLQGPGKSFFPPGSIRSGFCFFFFLSFFLSFFFFLFFSFFP